MSQDTFCLKQASRARNGRVCPPQKAPPMRSPRRQSVQSCHSIISAYVRKINCAQWNSAQKPTGFDLEPFSKSTWKRGAERQGQTGPPHLCGLKGPGLLQQKPPAKAGGPADGFGRAPMSPIPGETAVRSGQGRAGAAAPKGRAPRRTQGGPGRPAKPGFRPA